jgi:hypothetical protein
MYLLDIVCNKCTLEGILQTYLLSIRYIPLQIESRLNRFNILINGYNQMFGYKLHIFLQLYTFIFDTPLLIINRILQVLTNSHTVYKHNLPLYCIYARAAFLDDTYKFLYTSCVWLLPDDDPEMAEICLRKKKIIIVRKCNLGHLTKCIFLTQK